MLCFIFLGSPGFKIHLCEEIIRYSAFREHGVHIGANLVVSVQNPDSPYLYAVHRRCLDGIRLATHDEWQPNHQETFPYSHLFCNISTNRAAPVSGDQWQVAMTADPADGIHPVKLLSAGHDADFSIKDFLPVAFDFADYVPFTCLRIGPFPQSQIPFLLRFECHIGGSSFRDLIPEDLETGTRFYKVYGPEHIRGHIQTVDLPQALARPNGDAYIPHDKFLKNFIDADGIRLPSHYGVIAVDNPNCNTARLRPLNLTDDLENLSQHIDSSIYEHFALDLLRDRVHWFMCHNKSNSFYLQLLGPMAIAELLCAGEAR
jgi:hypothetical protein